MKKLAAAALVVVSIAAAVVFWRAHTRPRVTPLEAGWAAVAGVLAGDGTAGERDGDAAHARFADPFGIAVAPGGTIYVADGVGAHRIRAIAPDGTVTTLAGGDEGFADGRATSARFSAPSGLAAGPDGTLFVADTGNNKIRRVTPDGVVTTVAGILDPGYADGDGARARFNGPVGVTVDPSGRIIVADTYNDRIRAVETNGSVVTLAGSGVPGFLDGSAGDAQFDTPCGVATDRAGNVYVADTGNGAVRLISRSGQVTTLVTEPLVRPIGIAADDSGTLYVTDDRGRIIEIDPNGGSRWVAGSRPGFVDGDGARFRSLSGLAILAAGRLAVSDSRNALVRLVAARGRLGLRAPPSPLVSPRFDPEAFGAPLLWPVHPMEGPFEITGTMGEARGGSSERFHAGVDVHAPEGTIVRAVRSGTVTSPAAADGFGTLNESVRVGPLAYVHLRVGREQRGNDVIDPVRFVPGYDGDRRLVRVRVKRGSHFAAGDALGTTNAFNHVHLTVGWPSEEYNPLRFDLVQFADSVPPTIARGGIHVLDESGRALKERRKGRLLVAGRVQIVVDAWDQANGNERRRRLGVYRLGYQVLNRGGSPAPGFERARETIRFDRLTPDENAPRIVYASGSGIPFYGTRRTHFLYVVTNTFIDGVASAGAWDTTTLPAGDYVVRILAADMAGNEAIANRELAITVPAR